MATKQLSKSINGMNISTAKYFIENTSGLNIELIQSLPFSLLYSVKNHKEINTISVTVQNLNIDSVKASYTFIN